MFDNTEKEKKEIEVKLSLYGKSKNGVDLIDYGTYWFLYIDRYTECVLLGFIPNIDSQFKPKEGTYAFLRSYKHLEDRNKGEVVSSGFSPELTLNTAKDLFPEHALAKFELMRYN